MDSNTATVKNILELACDSCEPICTTDICHFVESDRAYVNLDEIYQILIENTGRFVESHAADLLITIPRIIECIADRNTTKHIIYFGLRRNGVDHEEFILNRLQDLKCYGQYYYRKIFAVRIEKQTIDDCYMDITVQLFDISNNIPKPYLNSIYGRKTDKDSQEMNKQET